MKLVQFRVIKVKSLCAFSFLFCFIFSFSIFLALCVYLSIGHGPLIVLALGQDD